MARAPSVRRSCFDEASAFAITRERRLERIDGLPHLSETGGAACRASKRAFVQLAAEKKAMSRRFFRAPDSREPTEFPFPADPNLGLSSNKIASIVLHSSLNIKFSIRESKQ
jgi:hypothetical protein